MMLYDVKAFLYRPGERQMETEGTRCGSSGHTGAKPGNGAAHIGHSF